MPILPWFIPGVYIPGYSCYSWLFPVIPRFITIIPVYTGLYGVFIGVYLRYSRLFLCYSCYSRVEQAHNPHINPINEQKRLKSGLFPVIPCYSRC